MKKRKVNRNELILESMDGEIPGFATKEEEEKAFTELQKLAKSRGLEAIRPVENIGGHELGPR